MIRIRMTVVLMSASVEPFDAPVASLKSAKGGMTAGTTACDGAHAVKPSAIISLRMEDTGSVGARTLPAHSSHDKYLRPAAGSRLRAAAGTRRTYLSRRRV